MITYYGGKARMAKMIIDLMPPHRAYVEPFGGGLAVLFRKPPSQLEVINDLDERLIGVYRCLQNDDQARELVGRLMLTSYSRAEYKRSAEAMKDETATGVEKAWASLVQVTQSINSRFGSGWRTSSPVADTVQGKSWTAMVAKVIEGIARLRHVEIECRDALEVIEQRDSKDTLFYCDPPYPGTYQGHYGGYSQEDFQRLWTALSKAKGHSMVSCYSDTVTEEMAQGWIVKRKTINLFANSFAEKSGADVKSRERTEEVWIRSTHAQRGLFDLATG